MRILQDRTVALYQLLCRIVEIEMFFANELDHMVEDLSDFHLHLRPFLHILELTDTASRFHDADDSDILRFELVRFLELGLHRWRAKRGEHIESHLTSLDADRERDTLRLFADLDEVEIDRVFIEDGESGFLHGVDESLDTHGESAGRHWRLAPETGREAIISSSAAVGILCPTGVVDTFEHDIAVVVESAHERRILFIFDIEERQVGFDGFVVFDGFLFEIITELGSIW